MRKTIALCLSFLFSSPALFADGSFAGNWSNAGNVRISGDPVLGYVTGNQPEGDILLDNLIAYLKLNEGAGTSAVDSSTQARTGTLTNGVTWVTGTNNSASSFTFTGSQFIVFNSPPIVGNLAAFTVSIRIKTQGLGAMAAWAEGNTASNNPLHYISINENAPGSLEWGMRDDAGAGGSFIDSGAASLTDNVYHNIVLVQYSKTKRDLFIDGTFRAGDNSTIGTLTMNTSNIGAQQRVATDKYYSGAIDQFRAYNVALTTAQIQALNSVGK